MVMNEQMFCVHQPERTQTVTSSFTWDPTNSDVNHKNVVFVSALTSAQTVTLESNSAKVPDGTVARVYRAPDAAYGVSVRFGTGGTSHPLGLGRMGEYVFTGGKWRSVVHDAAFVAQP